MAGVGPLADTRAGVACVKSFARAYATCTRARQTGRQSCVVRDGALVSNCA